MEVSYIYVFSISFSDSFKPPLKKRRSSSSGLGCFQALYNHSRAISGKDYANFPSPDLGIPKRGRDRL